MPPTLFDLLNAIPCPISRLCRIPDDLESVTCRGVEAPARDQREDAARERIWDAAIDLYRTGTQPGIQLCIRCEGDVVLHRSIGHARGNGPDDPPDARRVPLTLETPVGAFSAAKAITAMVIHKLDELNALRLDDFVCDHIPEFARHGKQGITIRHVLCHRAGIPNLPPEALDLDVLAEPEIILGLLCEARPQSRPGRLLAYHAVTGGFVLAEVVKRAVGADIRSVLESEITHPLGLRWMSYGVAPEHVDEVALNAFTGPPIPPPLKQLLRRALGTGIQEVVALSNDPRFLTGIIPSANVTTTADEASRFYQCLLDGGRHDGGRIFEPRTIRHATAEQSYWELDLTLGFPVRYGTGFMLGNPRIGPFGLANPQAFGHIGLSNVFTWADPERQISVALMTTGKAIASLHIMPLLSLIAEVGRAFPVVDRPARPPFATMQPATDLLH